MKMILLILAVFFLLMAVRWYRFTVCNLSYIATHPLRICRGRRRLKNMLLAADTLDEFESWANNDFRYKSDIIDYADWPLVFAMKWDKKGKWNGDCDAVSSLAWYWAGRKSLPASYVSIKRPYQMAGHAVCLIGDSGVWYMVDSTGVVPFMGWPVHYPNCKIIIRKTR
ncbi:MAG TPA: hypothetical protein VMW44_00245 [Candidatus Bathyarchaeia archaeon]|nr:hypothetical protein [Candidatus Bathyarchaeia archaeon]